MLHTIQYKIVKSILAMVFMQEVSLLKYQKWIDQLFFLFIGQSAEILFGAVVGAFRK